MPGQAKAYRTVDVAIVGGGPAGCATALALKRHAPSLSVALFEKSRYESLRPGEVLPGLARGLLDHLGVWTAFAERRFRPVFATAVSWGSAVLDENHSIYSARGHGWHLDRSAFDTLLADQARESGVEVFSGVAPTAIEEHCQVSGGQVGDLPHGWLLSLSSGTVLDARFVVDATGRSASVARQLGGRVLALDSLMGFARYFRAPDGLEPRTVIEARPEGWWYAAALDGDWVAIVAMTDHDIARQLHLESESAWHGMLARTAWVSSLISAGVRSHAEMVRTAGSALLEPACGDTWLAVGDAAAAYDPLSSQGIVKALRSGIFAAYAIAERLATGSEIGLERYRQFVRQSYQAYEEAYGKFYGMEQRWADQPFWKRRQKA